MGLTGKGNTLEYIASSLKDLPIPPFERFSREIIWFAASRAKKAAKRVGYPLIVRSDGNEDGLGASFAGLYNSVEVNSPGDFEAAAQRVRGYYDAKQIKQYALSRGVSVPQGPIDILLQQHSGSKMRAILTRHPHMKDGLFVDLEWDEETENLLGMKQKIPIRAGHLVKGDDLEEIIKGYQLFLKGESSKFEIEELKFQLLRAISDFSRIENLPDLNGENIAYQAEIGLFPYAVFQFRPFRKKEYVDFKLDDLSKKDAKHFFTADIAFGIVPKEGISLYHIPCEGPPSTISKKIPERGVNQLLDICKELINIDHPLALSFFDAGIYAPLLDAKSQKAPRLTIFNVPTRYYAWQAHNTFRFLERGSLVALAESSPYINKFGKNMRYWSDGIKGRIQFLN